MRKLVQSALLAGLIALGSSMAAVGAGDAPINNKQIMVLVGAFLVAAAKDYQAGLMTPPSH